MPALKAKEFDKLHRDFTASISTKHDCGQYCAPLNGGDPVCCDTGHAVPIVDKGEWKALKRRTDLWSKYIPEDDDKHGQAIVDELAKGCKAIECKGARHCERDNRTIACRSFPFYPYTDKSGEVIGLSLYWGFEDRCWVQSNLQIVEKEFIQQMLETYAAIFAKDDAEFDAYKEQSANNRRVFSRKKRPIPLLKADGKLYKILPKGAGIELAKPADFGKHGPYKSDKAYKKAVKEAEALYATEED